MEENKEKVETSFLDEMEKAKFEKSKKQVEEFSSIGTLASTTKPKALTKYTRDDIASYLNNIQRYWRELMTVSDWFYYNNGIYKNIMNSFANLATLDHLILPSTKTLERKEDKSYNTYYDKVNMYTDSVNIKLTTRRILKSIARYGAFVGYERNVGNEYYIQTLPLDYIRVKNRLGNDYQMEFNFQYFDKFWRDEDIEMAWELYPPEFKKLYNKFKADKKSIEPQWQMLDIKKTMYIPFDDDEPFFIPTFSGMFEALINNEDYKDMIKLGQELETIKLLVQKVPVDKDGNIQMSADLVKIFHSELVKILPVGANAVTTPLGIEPINFQSQNQIKEDLLTKAERGVFINSGMSSSIFADNNSHSGLQINIENVNANVFAMLEKIEDAFNRKFRYVVNSKNYEFRLKFFRTTNINITENFERNMKLLEIGGSITTIFSLLGFDVESYMTLLQIEDDLKIKDLLKLPQSIHTQSGSGQTGQDEAGRESLPEKELKDSGQRTRDLDSNNK